VSVSNSAFAAVSADNIIRVQIDQTPGRSHDQNPFALVQSEVTKKDPAVLSSPGVFM